MSFKHVVRACSQDDSGAALLEYALVAALVSMAALSALTLFGSTLQSLFGTAAANLTAIAQSAQ